MPSTCKSCGAPIRWVRVEKSGKQMPLDPDPDPRGNVRILPSGEAQVLTSEDLEAEARTAEMGGPSFARYVPHFMTCDFAATHRRRKA